MWSRLILTGVLAAAAAFAQPGGMGDMGGGGGRGGGMGGGMDREGMGGGVMRPSSRLEVISDMLKLDGKQKKEVKTIMDEGQKEATPVKDEMLKTRTALAEAVAAGKGQDEIKSVADAYAAAELKMQQIELGAFAKLYNLLEKDQQAKVRPVLGMMSGIFNGKNWNQMN